jgi:REP element-mobilizing transposase RayT
MKITYPEYWPQFFTATIHEWKHLFLKEAHKNIIIESLQFLVTQKRITLYGFVVMSNHVHIIWQPLFGFSPSTIQASFMKHTAKQLKASLEKNDTEKLAMYKVNKYDRTYQVWKREPLSVELRTPAVFNQKLEYMHNNPVAAGLSNTAESYYYSSARFYHDGIDAFGMLSHYSEN